MSTWSWLKWFLTVILLAPSSSSAQSVVPDCVDCRLQVVRTVRLGGAASGPEYVGFPSSLTALPDGRLLLIDRYDPVQLKVFDGAGSPIMRVGRRGKGPGEFENLQFVHFFEDGGVIELYDIGVGRITELDSMFNVVRTQAVDVPAALMAVLPDRSRVSVAPLVTPESVGLPMHFVDPDGRFVRSFGADPPIEDIRDWQAHVRHVSAASDSSVWAGHHLQYVISEWSVRGHRLRSLSREVAWFPKTDRGGFVDPDRRPDTALRALHADQSGRLWVVAWVADNRWREAIESRADPYGREFEAYNDPSAYFDSIVEVIDPRVPELVGWARVDEAVFGFVSDGVGYSYGLGEEGEPFIQVLEFHEHAASLPRRNGGNE